MAHYAHGFIYNRKWLLVFREAKRKARVIKGNSPTLCRAPLSQTTRQTSKGRGQSEKQSVQRKSSRSILTPVHTRGALRMGPGSGDMSADLWVSFTWRFCMRLACWGGGHIYLSLSNWHVGIDGGDIKPLYRVRQYRPGPLGPPRTGARHPISHNCSTKTLSPIPTPYSSLNLLSAHRWKRAHTLTGKQTPETHHRHTYTQTIKHTKSLLIIAPPWGPTLFWVTEAGGLA